MPGQSFPRASWFPLAAASTYLLCDYVGNSVISSLSGAPRSDAPVVAKFLARHEATIDLMALLIAVSGVCLASFALSLRRRLPLALPGDIVAGSGIVFAALSLCHSFVWWSATGVHSEEYGRALWELTTRVSFLSTVPAAVLVVVTSLTVRSHGTGPAWLWRSGLALTLLFLVPFLAWLTLKLFPLWAVASGVSLLRRGTWSSDAPWSVNCVAPDGTAASS